MKKLLIASALMILMGCGEEKPKHNINILHKFKQGDIVCDKLNGEKMIIIEYCDCSSNKIKLKGSGGMYTYMNEFELCKCDSIQHESY